MPIKRGFSDPTFCAGGESEHDEAARVIALGVINAVRTYYGLDLITWDFPALSTPHRQQAMRQGVFALAALEAAGFDVSRRVT